MPLELRRNSRYWYARVGADRKSVPLRVPVRGIPPPTLRQKGDEAFEASRQVALAKLTRFEKDLKSASTEEEDLRRLHILRTGGDFPEIRLDQMFERYAALPRAKPNWSGTRNAKQVASLFLKFSKFCAEQKPKNILTMSAVTPAVALAFINERYASGITAKSRNNDLVIMRAAFHLLGSAGSVYANPFGDIPKLDEDDSVPRRPFTGAELTAILKVAHDHPFICPIIQMAASTAARRGSCCLVRRQDVDLDAGVIAIKPAKCGARVRVPIFPMLRRTLEPIMAKPGKPSDFVFPEQAELMKRNPDKITLMVNEVLRKAGFAASDLSEARTRGLRRASIRSLHSFRTTWVTLALMAGIPERVIVLVTGHKTLEVVLAHYFNPQDAELRQLLEAKMPGAVTGGATITPGAQRVREIRVLVERLNASNVSVIKDDLLRLLADGPAPILELSGRS